MEGAFERHNCCAQNVCRVKGDIQCIRDAFQPCSPLRPPDRATFWIRWTDFNVFQADDGLAVDDFSLTAAPEPATYALLGGGLAGIGFSRRKK